MGQCCCSLRSFLRLGFGMVLCALAPPAFSAQAIVWSYAMPDVEMGQAWLLRHGQHCLAVSPTHVYREAGGVGLRGEGRKESGELSQMMDLGDDLAYGIVAGGLATRCGPPLATISRSVSRWLQGGAIGALRGLNGDGTVARTAVVVVDDDGQGMLRVKPTGDGARIQKGHSGSLLMIGDVPVGMLLSVNARSGVGLVVRVDILLARVEAELQNRTAAGKPEVDSPSVSLSAANGWEISRWSVDPVSSETSALNLLDGDAGRIWHARVYAWPVDIELHHPGGAVPVSGIGIAGARSHPQSTWPTGVEIQSSADPASGRWRAVGLFTLSYDAEAQAWIRFASTRASAIRLRFVNQGEVTEISLAEMGVVAP